MAFSPTIAGNGFLVSPDGTRLYSQNERLEVASNTLLVNLPVSIVSGQLLGHRCPGRAGHIGRRETHLYRQQCPGHRYGGQHGRGHAYQ